MKKDIAILAGDGIGPEVMMAALEILNAVADKFNHQFTTNEGLIGGAAFQRFQTHLPEETIAICKSADAILFGSVGGPIAEQQNPKWKNCEANSLLGLRKHFQFSVNYRPAKVYPALQDFCPLKNELIKDGCDLLIIRELVGDIYFGEHKFYQEGELRAASDLATYNENQIRIAIQAAFKAAKLRKQKVTSVDKANVLHTSKLWREIMEEEAQLHPEIKWEHQLVDNCAMQIVKNPAQFDVIVCPNLFGDILSDIAAVLPGSLGLTPSASINPEGFGMYEPSGGSAPDIAGLGIANPIAQILSVAMMLNFSFNLTQEAEAIENAVNQTLEAGFRTKDLTLVGQSSLSTTEITKEIISRL